MDDFSNEAGRGSRSDRASIGETLTLSKVPEQNGELVPSRVTLKFVGGEHPRVEEEQKFSDMGVNDRLLLLATVGTVLQQSELPFQKVAIDSVDGVTVSLRVFDRGPLFTDKRPVVLPDVLVNIAPAGIALVDPREPKPEELHLERSADGEMVVITGDSGKDPLIFIRDCPDIQARFKSKPEGDRMIGQLGSVLLDVGLRKASSSNFSQVSMK